jgi:endonuclease-3
MTIKDLLVQRGEQLLHAPFTPVVFSGERSADALLNNLEQYPHAFVLGCVLDRGDKIERIWQIQYQMSRRIGSFEIYTLRDLSLRDIHDHMISPAPLHHWFNKMSVIFYEGVQRIAHVYEGDASRIWTGQPSCREVVSRFREFSGAGQKIAAMAARILVFDFKIPLSDYSGLPIPPDRHVQRVFYRLKLIRQNAEPDEIVDRARSLHPDCPGMLDAAWEIGRNWCRADAPLCAECVMRELCPTAARMH